MAKAAAKKVTKKKAKANPRNKKLYDEGMKMRKAVLGAAYVDNSMAGAANDEFMMVVPGHHHRILLGLCLDASGPLQEDAARC